MMNKLADRATAVNRFYAARQMGRRLARQAVVAGRDPHALPFEVIRNHLELRTSFDRGIQDILLDQIIGSQGRAEDFTRQFYPLSDALEERWVNISILAEDMGWTPIEVYQLGQVYFVIDGNHRVSVARQMGVASIEAKVTEYQCSIPIHVTDSLNEILLRYDEQHFLETTGLNGLRPNHHLFLTVPGYYDELLAQIEDLQAQLSLIDGVVMPYEEAVAAWYDMLYLPVNQIIHEAQLLDSFPSRTETDLYVWLAVHREQLAQRYGQEHLTALARALAEEYREVGFQRLLRQIWRWFGQLAPLASERLEPEMPANWLSADDRLRPETAPVSLAGPLRRYTRTRRYCWVTFSLPAAVRAHRIMLVGDFNQWNAYSHPMSRLADGSFSLTIILPAGRSYRFRYLLDEWRWENDWHADAYVPNPYGEMDSVVYV